MQIQKKHTEYTKSFTKQQHVQKEETWTHLLHNSGIKHCVSDFLQGYKLHCLRPTDQISEINQIREFHSFNKILKETQKKHTLKLLY